MKIYAILLMYPLTSFVLKFLIKRKITACLYGLPNALLAFPSFYGFGSTL